MEFFMNDSDKGGNWWLRSSGFESTLASYVEGDGSVNDVGAAVNERAAGIRPALWIKLNNFYY